MMSGWVDDSGVGRLYVPGEDGARVVGVEGICEAWDASEIDTATAVEMLVALGPAAIEDEADAWASADEWLRDQVARRIDI